MHAWDTMVEFRDTFAWQHGRHGFKFGGEYRRYIWPMWGFFPESRLLPIHERLHNADLASMTEVDTDLANMLLSLPAVKQRQAGIPQMNLRAWGTIIFAEDSCNCYIRRRR